MFGRLHQFLSTLFVALQEHAIPCLVVGIVLQRDRWLFGVEYQRVLALLGKLRMVAIQWPVSRLHCQLLLLQPSAYVYPMRYTMAICNDERRAVIGLRLQEGVQRLLVVGAHRHA